MGLISLIIGIISFIALISYFFQGGTDYLKIAVFGALVGIMLGLKAPDSLLGLIGIALCVIAGIVGYIVCLLKLLWLLGIIFLWLLGIIFDIIFGII